jgi:hypothetical protein
MIPGMMLKADSILSMNYQVVVAVAAAAAMVRVRKRVICSKKTH